MARSGTSTTSIAVRTMPRIISGSAYLVKYCVTGMSMDLYSRMNLFSVMDRLHREG